MRKRVQWHYILAGTIFFLSVACQPKMQNKQMMPQKQTNEAQENREQPEQQPASSEEEGTCQAEAEFEIEAKQMESLNQTHVEELQNAESVMVSEPVLTPDPALVTEVVPSSDEGVTIIEQTSTTSSSVVPESCAKEQEDLFLKEAEVASTKEEPKELVSQTENSVVDAISLEKEACQPAELPQSS